MSKIINRFRGKFSFLSNMHTFNTPIVYEGIEYFSSENLFQALKSVDALDRRFIATLTPPEAKKYSKELFIRPDWEENKLKIMEFCIKKKFNPLQRKSLVEKLILTKGFELVEGNYHGDVFWGVDLNSRKGENHLGEILMKIRSSFTN